MYLMVWYQVMLLFWPTYLPLPDLGRNQNMMLHSCRLHMPSAKHGYASCHIEFIGGDAWEGIAPHQTMGY